MKKSDNIAPLVRVFVYDCALCKKENNAQYVVSSEFCTLAHELATALPSLEKIKKINDALIARGARFDSYSNATTLTLHGYTVELSFSEPLFRAKIIYQHESKCYSCGHKRLVNEVLCDILYNISLLK